MEHRLYRSRTDRMLFGVCGGLAKYFGVDSSIMRIIVILLALTTAGVGILVYFLMVLIVPLEGSTKTEPKEVIAQAAEEIKTTAEGLGKEIQDTFGGKKTGTEEAAQVHARRRNLFGLIIIIIGVLLLLGTIGPFNWQFWAVLWPVVLILIGLVMIISVSKKA